MKIPRIVAQWTPHSGVRIASVGERMPLRIIEPSRGFGYVLTNAAFLHLSHVRLRPL
jgi:hypothetical protein